MKPFLQANDKEAFLHRFTTVEATLKDAIERQLAAEASLDGKVAAHRAELAAVAADVATGVEQKEGVLREQMEGAMRKIRAYAREVEQNMESVRAITYRLDVCYDMCLSAVVAGRMRMWCCCLSRRRRNVVLAAPELVRVRGRLLAERLRRLRGGPCRRARS